MNLRYPRRLYDLVASPLGGIFAFLILSSVIRPAFAIDGPGVSTIANANWGVPGIGANDQWPHVVRLEIDVNLSGAFGDSIQIRDTNGVLRNVGDSFCTGTLVAPDVIVTAGHCFPADYFASAPFSFPPGTVLTVGPQAEIHAGHVRVNFGAAGTRLNGGGLTNGVVATTPDDFAFLTLRENALAPFSPIAMLPRPPRVGDVNFAVGFGCEFNNNPNVNAGRACGVVGGFGQHTDGAKNWGTLPVEGVTADFVQQNISAGERWTERGDSGGPGILRYDNFPDRAYKNISHLNLVRGDFVMSAVSGGPTPVFDPVNAPMGQNGFCYPGDVCGPANNPDLWTRLDSQWEYLNGSPHHSPISMRPTVEIFHNLPDDPSLLAPGAPVGVMWVATYPAGSPWLLNLRLWEEDNELAAPYSFSGDVYLGPTNFNDDLAGFGHSAGKLPDGVTTVCAWDVVSAGALAQFAEVGNPFDPPLDWVFQVNYTDNLQFLPGDPEVFAVTYNNLNTLIQACSADINAGDAVMGGFALVPEPTVSSVAGMALLLISLRTRSTTRRSA